MCSVKGAEKSVLYSWTPRDPHASESNGGSILTISRMPCEPDLPYTCIAQNLVSQSSSHPVHVGQFCTDPGASRGGKTGETVVGILGEPVTLPLALPACRHTEKVVWLFNTSIISKERDEAATADPLIKSRDPYKNRVWVSSQDCSLKISQLKIEDAGPYRAYVCSEASRVTSMTHVTLLIYREEDRKKTISLSFLGLIRCKRQSRLGPCSKARERWGWHTFISPAQGVPEPTAGHMLYSVLSQEYEKLDTPLRPARQRPRPASDSSSDSNITTEEDADSPEVHKPINGRDEVYDQVTQEGAEHDPAPKGQADYNPITPYVTEVESVVGENTMYAQVFFNLQGKTPVSQMEESSATIYCSIQKPQTVVPPPQQNDLEIPESPTFENFT
uniref:Ig-like domain-containing protein n=1 Tax=Papio anubis TaxID=9555 RepID=A0A2I3MNE8_PAPAN